MARSMTAFARVEATGNFGRAVWELRSVNHRYIEIGLRLPEELRAIEGEVRARIAARLNRGKVDCSLRLESAVADEAPIQINTGVAKQLVGAVQAIADLLPNAAAINPLEVLRWPGVLTSREIDFDALSVAMVAQLEQALDQLVASREREGAKLQEVVLQRCHAMADITTKLRAMVPEIIGAIRQRHAQRIQELTGTLDPARIETECALLVQKLDVAEELDRLQTHLAEVERVMRQREPIGRRLDFLMQELNREANTLGSKSAHVDTSGASIELKVLIEQIREQIQNIE
ncbi:MAG: YicC family protein [Gammaproteobacteria bacterium]|nr:YicC family protein [Gammaproteobacteria bacterium]